MIQVDQPSSLGTWIVGQLIFWYTWAAMAPFILRLGRRFRVDRGAWLRNALLHLVVASVVSVVQSLIAVFGSIAVHGEPTTWEYFSEQIVPYLWWRGPWGILVYAFLLGIDYAVDYSASLKERELVASRLEAQVSRARLEALQRQLEPHFLFNTLNSISVLMQKGEVDTANEMLGDLSELLRYVLSEDSVPLVALQDELEIVRRYGAIESQRFGGLLDIAINAPSDVLSIPVPSFILQQLVENAIRHGVSRKSGRGRVDVTAVAESGHLTIRVRDNGVGLRGGSPDASRDGTGLRNARERLAHIYGRDHRLELADDAQGGVLATLRIPVSPPSLPSAAQ
jgi:signal transduction histidine kinase